MDNVFVFDHPLMHHKLSYLRDKSTPPRHFRQIVKELALLMAYEVTSDLPSHEVTVETPLADASCQRVDEENIVIIPILRAGLGMVEGFHSLLPEARVGHIGMSRNEETLEPEPYYHKLPAGIDTAQCIVVDPMLATGGSAVDAVNFLKSVGATNIKFCGIIGTDAGIRRLSEAHPDVAIYLAEKDPILNDHGYIEPGLGDAGDRIFGTL